MTRMVSDSLAIVQHKSMVLGEIMLEHRVVLALLLSTLAGTRNPPGVIMEAIEIIMLGVIVHSEERLFCIHHDASY